ncbi:MAG TPA: 50S ribosomal protein L9 [Synergistetes bacterium]|nr:50S ribosomal protein L9 [Synergistota bacterium]
MKVILLSDVTKLGRKGDLIEVSEGYARNYLVPRKMAEEATKEKLEEWKQRQKAMEKKAKREEEEARTNKNAIQGKQVVIMATAGDKGKLFGSVTAGQISDGIREKFGIDLDRKDIKLPGQIKEVGSYPFSIKIYPGIEAEMTVLVEAEKVE